AVKETVTLCRQVASRHEALGALARQYGEVVFVSGKKSSNGRVLYEVCLKHNPNTYFVSDPSELNPENFKSGDTVGICGATSTPMWLMEQVKATVESF